MSLLSLCQGALREIGEFEVPSTIIGNANQTAVQILNLAQREGVALSRRHGWQALTKEHSFATAEGTASYALPSDLLHIVTATWWDRANSWPLHGPATPQQWQRLKSGLVAEGVRRWFRIQGDQLRLHPTPSVSGDEIAFSYVSNEWCKSAGGAGQRDWAADTDSAVVDEELVRMGVIWRFLKAKGMDYAEEFNAYEREIERAVARDGAAPIIDVTGAGLPGIGVNLPEGGFAL